MLSEEQTHDETRHVHIIDGVEYVMGTPEYAAALAEWQERTAEMFAEDKARWEATRPLSAEEAIAALPPRARRAGCRHRWNARKA